MIRRGLELGLLLTLLPVLAAAGDTVRVRVGERVEKVGLEDYVASAVASEVYSSWPPESLKAQAVVARTYAMYQRGRHTQRGYDLESSVLSQRYGVEPVLDPVQRAVDETRGQHLTFDGQPILAAFHSAAGGRTASSKEVWGQALPYLRSVVSPDDDAPDHFWSYELSAADLLASLRNAGIAAGSVQISRLRRSKSGRVETLEIGGARLSGRDLRGILGGRALRSALFEVRAFDGLVRFVGSGAGHGVGLSQWGARELALRKRGYQEILAHYYPGTRLQTLGGRRP